MARSLFHEPKTAPMAPRNWSWGSLGKSWPVRSWTSFLKRHDQFLQRGGVELRVGDMLAAGEEFVLQALDDGFERLVMLARALLHAHDDVAVHLDEAAVAVVGEALVRRWRR